MAQKKAKAPEPAGESAPMWIVSFADLVTLMMSFFVVLYALKEGGAKQQIEVAAAIKATFDSSIPPADTTDEFELMIRRFKGLPGPPYVNTGGETQNKTQGAAGPHPDVINIRPGNVVVTGSRITFDPGGISLDDESKSTIQQLYTKLQGHNNVVMIKGHISVDEIGLRPDDKDGMELSYQRATVVAKELEKLGIDRRVLRPVACGPFEPVSTGAYDPKTLRENRRVEIFTTDDTASQFAPEKIVDLVPATAPTRTITNAKGPGE